MLGDSSIVVLDHGDVRAMLPMRECIDIVERSLVAYSGGEMDQLPRLMLKSRGASGAVALMGASRGTPTETFGVKIIGFFPQNSATGLSAHQGVMVVLDGQTGVVSALIDAAAVTELRTAAVSAVATRALARDDASVLSILGSGCQARAHVESLCLVRNLRVVRIWSRNQSHAAALAAEIGSDAGVSVKVEATPQAALRDADIVVTATASPSPIVRAKWLKPGAHVNTIGGAPGRLREIHRDVVEASAVYVESKQVALSEDNEIRSAVRSGVIVEGDIRGELGDVLSGRSSGRANPTEITLFRSLGLAAEDLAVGEWLARRS